MSYDLFISYAHQGDNTSREAVTALVARLHAELESDFRRRFDRDLEIFFDKEDIQDFEHWQVRCHRALRDSRFFIACLSRTYLRSDACRWEWEEWCRHELEHGLVGQGAASLWFVKLEDLDAPEDAELLRRWEGDLLQRFHIQCHEWRHSDPGAFLDAAALGELRQLTEHVAQRLRLLTLDRARRGNLPWPNTNFVGREPELARLRAALLDAPEPAPSGIHGVGGMGKTALAQAFAYSEADGFPGGCWLLRCEGHDRLIPVFRGLVHDLGLELTEEEKLDDVAAVRRVFNVLRERGPTLFLLDNVDRPAMLAQAEMGLVADQPWARLLHTTRLAPDEFARAGAIIHPVDLDRLPDNQAVDLIRRYQHEQAFASAEHEAAALGIVRELSGLTLAVETAAVHLGQCDPRVAEAQYAVDVRNYLNKLRDDLKTGGGEGVMNQLREATATLRPTLARLDAPARTVLQIASLLAPDGVALPWVRAIAGQSHPELAADAATGEGDPWTQLIRGLIGMRLFQPTAEPRIVAIHRILQRVLESELLDEVIDKEQLSRKLIRHAKERCVFLCDDGWVNPKSRWEIEPLRASTEQWLISHPDKAVSLANPLAVILYELGRFTEAEALIRRTLTVAKKLFGEHSAESATAMNNLALLFNVTGRVAEAEPLGRQALAIFQSILGPSHLNVAPVLNNIAESLRANTQPSQAEDFYKRALAIFEEHGASTHPLALRMLNNLAQLVYDTNRLEEAEFLMRRALATAEQATLPRKPAIVRALNDLAQLLHDTNRFAEAEKLMRRSLSIAEEVFDSEHPELAAALNNLGRLLYDTNRLDEAEPLMRSALRVDERVFGVSHANVATDLSNLGMLCLATSRVGEAEQLLQGALTIDEHAFGKDHSNVARDLTNLSLLFLTSDRHAEAEPMCRRALSVMIRCTRFTGQEHAHLRTSVGNYVVLLLQSEMSPDQVLERVRILFDEGGVPALLPEILAELFHNQGR